MSRVFLLHGDLHHFNILASGNDWIAIDPKGIVGERECEIAPLVLNPTPDVRRIDQLCDELDLDRERAHAWTFVRTVLALLWAQEDHAEIPAAWLECAELLKRISGAASADD